MVVMPTTRKRRRRMMSDLECDEILEMFFFVLDIINEAESSVVGAAD
jgi:hypothetical protein